MPQPERFPEFPPDSVMHGIQPPQHDVKPDARQPHQPGEAAPSTSFWFTPTHRPLEPLSANSAVDSPITRAPIHPETDELGVVPPTLHQATAAGDPPLFRETETTFFAQLRQQTALPVRTAGPEDHTGASAVEHPLDVGQAGGMLIVGLRVRNPNVGLGEAPIGQQGVAAGHTPTREEASELEQITAAPHGPDEFGDREAVVALERASHALRHHVWVGSSEPGLVNGRWVLPEEAGFTRVSVDPEDPKSPQYWRHPDGYTIGYKDATGQQDAETDPPQSRV